MKDTCTTESVTRAVSLSVRLSVCQSVSQYYHESWAGKYVIWIDGGDIKKVWWYFTWALNSPFTLMEQY